MNSKTLPLFFALGAAAQAASISYQEINSPSDADVVSLPTLIMAKNFGGTPGAAGGAEVTTVNGITFEAATASTGFNTSVADPQGTITLSGGDSTFDGFAASPTDLGPDLNAIFKGLIRASLTPPEGQRDFTIALTGLQVGTAYQLQLFFSSGTQSARSVDFEDSSTNLLGTWDNARRESIVLLSFVADQADETVTLGQNNGDAAVISAMIFSADPNPLLTTPPSDLTLSRSTLNQSGAISGETLGSLTTIDPDIGDTHTYALVAGEGDTDNGSFTIDEANLNFNSDLTPGSYTVRIQTTDGASNSYSEALELLIIANQAPSVPSLNNGLINSENALPAPAGFVNATDPNLAFTPEDSISYTLVSGDGDLHNALFEIDAASGVLLLNQASTPGQVFSLRVRATDTTGLFTETIVTPTVVSSFVGRPLGPRATESSDGDTRVLQPNNIAMEAGQVVGAAAVYIQDAANQNGKTFQLLLLRPTGVAGESDVIYRSGEITIVNGQDGSTSIFTFPNGPIETQAGDIFAHYGRGIPYSDGGEGTPIFYPVEAPPALGAQITLGQGDYPIRNDLPRDYAWAAVVVETAPPTPLNLQIERGEENIILRWVASPGITYRIEGSSDLTSWPVDFNDSFVPPSENAEFTLPTPANEKFFFRVIDANANP